MGIPSQSKFVKKKKAKAKDKQFHNPALMVFAILFTVCGRLPCKFMSLGCSG